jgi:tripartite ATP-independent transporter DctM subunit
MALLIVSIIASMYAGIATPTEAAAIGATVALILAIFLFRIPRSTFFDALIEAAIINGFVMLIVVSAHLFSYFVALSGIAVTLCDLIVALGMPPWAVIVAICVVFFILGCFMDSLTILVVLVPILIPTLIGMGFDLVWFGVVMVINVEIGLITPPFGLNLFAMKGIWGDPMGKLIRGVLPFLAVLLVLLAIIVALPQLSLWLPSMM